jgi:hypothetical protein
LVSPIVFTGKTRIAALQCHENLSSQPFRNSQILKTIPREEPCDKTK